MARGSATRATCAPTLERAGGIEFWLQRKRIKHAYVRVKGDGRVEVSAPLRMSRRAIDAMVLARAGWIERCRSEAARSPERIAEQASDAEVAEWHACVAACVPKLVAAWEPVMGVRAGKLAYRNMTSRWGSCQPATGRICINVRLALYPPECLEYVVVHELCHLLVPGHGPDFYALMDRLMPDWRERRAKLR